MIELTNCISKIFYTDNKSYSILTYIDIDKLFTEELIINYINKLIQKNKILTQYIIENNKKYFLKEISTFNINDYYTIIYNKTELFDSYINNMLNEKFNNELKWKFLWCIDKNSNKTRLYFKIHHAYVDGYQLIKILISPFQNYNITTKFKRNTTFFEKIYYYIIGTILLMLINLKIFINILLKYNDNIETDLTQINTDYIICKELDFNKIKIFTIKHNITINDFLYSLMIKTDKLYRKQEKNLITSSPINISGTTQTNNMCPIFNIQSNSIDDYNLLKNIHSTFNNFKYSLFIPMLSYIINTITPNIELNILSKCYNNIINNSDYLFSNIIGPSINNLNINITDIHFLITAKNTEIIYNIISSGHNINIICSFKNGIIKDKKQFEQCIYEAYNILVG